MPSRPVSALQPSLPGVTLAPLRSVRILDQLRERIRLLHYSQRTEQAYAHWCRAFIRFHGVGHQAAMSGLMAEGGGGFSEAGR